MSGDVGNERDMSYRAVNEVALFRALSALKQAVLVIETLIKDSGYAIVPDPTRMEPEDSRPE